MINVINTNTAPYQVYDYMVAHGIKEDSRNGRVLTVPHPVLIHYMRPWECVNLCPVRDANPFFHFMEMIWFLEGRGDVAFIAHYLPRMAEYSDDGIMFNAHYGYNIRNLYKRDQLKDVVHVLRQDPLSRQAVIQIWNPADLTKKTKDKACNLLLIFRIVNDTLTMTVANRSNDALWGGVTGANITNLFIFQAYVAYKLNLPIGSQYVMSNNLHLYLDNPKTQRMLDKYTGKIPPYPTPPYPDQNLVPLIDTHSHIEASAAAFCAGLRMNNYLPIHEHWHLRSLTEIGVPMAHAHHAYRHGKLQQAVGIANTITASDWREACVQWLERRMTK